MKKVLVIINGWAESGKDTFEKAVREELEMMGWKTNSLSSIKLVWDLLSNDPFYIPMDIKGDAERNLAAEIKSALNRYNNTVDRMNMTTIYSEFSKARGGLKDINYLQMLHVREPESIDFIKQQVLADNWSWEVKTLFVQSDRGKKNIQNAADQNVMKYKYDDTITNNGSLADLQAQAIVYAHKFV